MALPAAAVGVVSLAVQILPLLIQAGMDITPTIQALVNANEGNTEETKNLLHQQRSAALQIINDRSRDVPAAG